MEACQESIAGVWDVGNRAPLLDTDPYFGEARPFFRRACLMEAASFITAPQRVEEWVGRVRERYQNVDWKDRSATLHHRAVRQALLGREWSEGTPQGLAGIQTFSVV